MASFEYEGTYYEFVMSLGTGSFADTYQYMTNDGSLYTVKIFKPQTRRGIYNKEVTTLKKLSKLCHIISVPCLHTNFIVDSTDTLLYEIFSHILPLVSSTSLSSSTQSADSSIYRVIIYNFFNGIVFSDIISGRYKKTIPFDLQLLLSFGEQLLYIISVLHDNGIAHRDIKPRNIIWNFDTKQLSLIDFGTACEEQHFITPFAGTLLYVLPEVVNDDKYVSFEQALASDMYAIGVNMYIYITGYNPYPVKEVTQVLNGVKKTTLTINTTTDPFRRSRPNLDSIPMVYYEILEQLILDTQQNFNIDSKQMYNRWREES